MTDLTLPGTSPFDAIRRLREDGSEYWRARDLQPFMGYRKWQDFQNAVERAQVAATNAGHDPQRMFVQVSQLMDAGNLGQQERLDYELSRFACYLTFLNGDPRKPEVAAAQAYFAIKTREAETGISQAKELTRADLARMVLAAEEELAVVSAALESAAPAIAYHERFVIDSDVATIKVWGAQFGLTEPQAFELLRDKKVIYRQSLGFRWSTSQGRKVEEFEHRAYAGRQSFGWFDLRPQHNAPRHHNGQVRQTLYVRAAYALDLGRAVGAAPKAAS